MIMPLPYGAKVFYPLAVAVIVPMMFRITQSNRADRVIGELSYSFYIFHMFALALAEAMQVHWQLPGRGRNLAWAGPDVSAIDAGADPRAPPARAVAGPFLDSSIAAWTLSCQPSCGGRARTCCGRRGQVCAVAAVFRIPIAPAKVAHFGRSELNLLPCLQL